MSTELTTRPSADVVQLQSDPTGGRLVAWAQAAQAANQLARALVTTTFVPTGETEGNATAKILMGDELGLSPIASLRSIYVVHGTPALYAKTMVALAQSHGHEVWTEETSDSKVIVCGRRKGADHVERSEWSIARATKAGYTGNKKYASNPQEMLYSKAAGEIARKIAADVLAGIPFSVEDIELGEVATVTVTREPSAAKRVGRAPKPEPVEPAFDVSALPEVIEPDGSDDDVQPAGLPALTDHTRRQMFALLTEAGFTDADAQREGMGKVLGRTIASRSELTESDAQRVVVSLQARAS